MQVEKDTVKKIVIVGGGTAGWMAAASISSLIGKDFEITLVESDEIGTVGVGEATIPTFFALHQLLKIDEAEFLSEVQGTIKLGISFENWHKLNETYIHAFGHTGKSCWAAGFHHFWLKGKECGYSDDYGCYSAELAAAKAEKFGFLKQNKLNYAYHLNAGLYAKYLRKLAEKNHVVRQEGRIKTVNQDASGNIASVVIESGKTIVGDFFVDCSGFSGLLIDKVLKTEYQDWSHWLPCDRAIAIQTKSTQAPVPYTRSIAHESGWQWRIPLQSRVGNGLVYSSRYMNDEVALETLMSNIDGEVLSTPNFIKFKTGQRTQHWNKNCVAVGLSAGFLEPLESTSIHLIQRAIIRLMQMFPFQGVTVSDRDEFNKQMSDEYEYIRDFIIMHYHVSQRDDSKFWRDCRSMEIPSTLQHKLDLFVEAGRVFHGEGDVFAENSWTQVMLGQGLMPNQYHPIVNMMSDSELENFLSSLKTMVDQSVKQLPSHELFLSKYCPAT